MAASEEKSGRARWVVAGACALALGGAAALATSLGWTNGRVGAALLIVSALVAVAVKLATDHLPDASRGQVLLASTLVVVIFAGVLGAAYKWGREEATAEVVELAPPAQRELGDLQSECGVPQAELLTGAGSSRILSTRVAIATEERGDFIAAVVAEPTADSPLPESETLVVLECDGASWNLALTKTTDSIGCWTDLETTQLRSPEQEEVLFRTVCGSGAFLDYQLIGFDDTDDSVQAIQAEEGIFQGVVRQLRDLLVVEAGTVRQELAWDGEQFVAAGDASSIPAAEGVVVAFWWDADGGHADLNDVPVQVGERVYFYWDKTRNTDDSVQSLRILQSTEPPSGNSDYGDDERGQTYTVLNEPGLLVEMSIIPNGYDWDNAIYITVHS